MLKRLSAICLLAGGAILVWCCGTWISAAVFENYEALSWNIKHPVVHRMPSVSALVSEPPFARTQARPKLHDVIAWLDIPRLGISTAVLEGDDDLALRLGAGHIPETPIPGAAGNVGIAAHRDSFFRSLAGIVPLDRIRLQTSEGSWEYTVESTRVVQPSNVSVLANADRPELTLVTCYPFRYVGPAPLRFIVRARLTG